VVVSRFARRDWLLSSEFELRADSGPAPDSGRSLAEYVVTGAVVDGGRLYAISAAFSTLLVVDLETQLLRGAYAVPGLVDPVGLAARGEELLVAQRDGRVVVIARPPR
jgi:hypothetical protein